MTENEHKSFFKELYSKQYVESFINDMKKWSSYKSNGIKKISDMKCQNFNIRNCCIAIITDSIDSVSNKKIFFFGPCIWFGAYVDDEHTIQSYLYDEFNNEIDYKVVNCSGLGAWGVDRMISEKISCDDIVIVFVSTYAEDKAWKRCIEEFPNIHIQRP